MKILSSIKKHKLFAILTTVLILVVCVLLVLQFAPKDKIQVSNVTRTASVIKTIEPTVGQDTEDVEEAQPTNTPEPTTSTPPSSPTPEPVKSTQEYGEQYLNLSTSANQKCFDLIVATWPERFTADVREGNIKALRAWANPCSTGIELGAKWNYQGTIYRNYGIHGEFFDSELANNYRDRA